MIPDHVAVSGNLPLGEHVATWQELTDRHGCTDWKRPVDFDVITNHRQYLNTQAQVERFRQALAAPDSAGLHPKAAKAMREGLRSELADLQTEHSEYDALRGGGTSTLEADSIVGIGAALLEGG